ncbi:primosomal protein N' [Candidatus Saccharibacteria bacterium]|nr:primosomal protein N' [Candidatus Saccharibacteria bacterium]NCU40554.1 primosomal protein N' [Candidatus Saccharibacteria bacterium]
MKWYEVSPLKQVHHSQSILTYQSELNLNRGQIVSVDVGKAKTPAVVLSIVKKPSFETKPIDKVITTVHLPEPLLILSNWISEYYTAHPAQVWRTILPSGILKTRRHTSNPQPAVAVRDLTTQHPTTQQQTAIEQIWSQSSGTSMLHGVTGSGKTLVYIELAKRTVAEGRSVIILVPEIALTSQIVADITPHFDRILVTHSTMTDSVRHRIWQEILNNEHPQVIIGPRSALFMPVRNLGLVVIDECHEPAFKQEKSPRYSALRAASVLTKAASARLVLGSATPSVSDYFLAKSNNNLIATLDTPARKNTVAPDVSVVDMTKQQNFTRSTFLSNTMLEGITNAINNGNQALLFHNRRGSAPITLCENCGWSSTCPRCFIPLTLHTDEFRLRCHICNHIEKVPTACPDCLNTNIIHKGIGTKRIEEEIGKLFPSARTRRFDGDSKEGVDAHYQALYDGTINIIIGTQVIAKGLDLPYLRFVGVIQADSGLALPDYQSSERVFQLLAQVTGRVGRNEHPSQVVIQSYQPSHQSVEFGTNQNYAGFYEWCINERKRALFPPFVYLMKLTTSYKTESAAVHAAKTLAKTLHSVAEPNVTILGPVPAFYERTRSSYRWQLILKSHSRANLVKLFEQVPSKGWQTELDPISLL